MGGSDGGVIIRNLKSALQVGCNRSGSVKLWYVLIATHVAVFVVGKAL